MREICQSGSEGGEPQTNAASLPLSKYAATASCQMRAAIGAPPARTCLAREGVLSYNRPALIDQGGASHGQEGVQAP